MLKLDGLVSKIYRKNLREKGIHAVSNVRLGLSKNGDVISLIRESGSGKSTIAR